MREDLATMILLNTTLGIAQLESMEDELLSQVILHPISSTFLLREAMMATIISTRTQKLPKI